MVLDYGPHQTLDSLFDLLESDHRNLKLAQLLEVNGKTKSRCGSWVS